MVKVGASIPSVDLYETTPGTKVDLSKELSSGKGLIIGVPAAFSKFSSLFSRSLNAVNTARGFVDSCN